MSTDFIPRSNAHAFTYYTTLANAIAVDPEQFGVGAEEVAALQARVQELGASLQRVDRLENERAAEVDRRQALSSDVEATVRDLVRRVHANPAVSDALKAAAGIPVHDRVRSHLAPVQPTHLVVTTEVSGENHLAWKTGGQGRATMDRIEARSGAETEFTLLDHTTAPRYVHRGRKPGAPIVYRVLARRSNQLSAPSNEAGIYEADGSD